MNVNEQAYGSKDLWYSIPNGLTQFPSSTTIEERNTLANFTDTIPSSIDWHLQLGRVIYEVEVNGNQTLKDLFYNTVFDRSICFVGQSGKSSYKSIRFFDNQGTDSNNPDARELPTQTYDVVNLAFSNGLGAMRDYGNGVRSWEVIGADIDRDPSGNPVKFDAIRWNPLGWFGTRETNDYQTSYDNRRNSTTFITNLGVKRNVLIPYVKAGTTDTSDTNAIRTYDLATYLSTYKDAKPYVYSIGFETTVMYGESIEASSSNQRTLDSSYNLMLMEYINSLNDFYYIGPNNEWKTSHYNNDLFVPQTLKSPHMPLGGYINNGSHNAEAPSTLGYEKTLNSVGVHAVIDCNDIKWDTWVNVGSSTAEGTCNKVLVADARKYTEEEFREAVRHSLACFGMFFADSQTVAQEGKLDDPEMHLGTIVDGVGYGDYTSGKDNRNQPQWNWNSMSENDYDPTNPPSPPGPEPDPNPVIPDTPGFSLAVGNGSVCYTITKAEWAQIWDNIYGGGKKNFKALIEGLALYGSNPLNAILNYRWYPFYLNGGDTRPLRLGNTIVKPATNVYHCIGSSEQAFTSATGSFIWGRPKNFVNTRKTKARLFLPFYGFYDLPTSLLVNKELEVQFQYNLPDDNGVWFIMFGGSVYDYVECQPFIEIPITGDNSLQIAAAKAQRNLQIAATIGTAVGGAVMGAMVAAPGVAAVINAGKETAWATGNVLSGALSNIGPLLDDGLLKTAHGAGIMGATGALAGGGIKTANAIMQSALKIGELSTNVPVHNQASDTTFLHLTKYPYIQIYTNTLIDGFNESEYKWKVGIACDKWGNLASMPEQTLLATTGTANMGTDGMLIDEVKELNDILQSGFYR